MTYEGKFTNHKDFEKFYTQARVDLSKGKIKDKIIQKDLEEMGYKVVNTGKLFQILKDDKLVCETGRGGLQRLWMNSLNSYYAKKLPKTMYIDRKNYLE